MELYGAVMASRVATCVADGRIAGPSQPGTDHRYIGLRETYEQAVDRVKTCLPKAERAYWKSHVAFFVVTFSAEAWMRSTVDWNLEAGVPVLRKKEYKGMTNWGVWHYAGLLPLYCADPVTGDPFIRVRFCFVPSAMLSGKDWESPSSPSLPLRGVWAPRDGLPARTAPPPLLALPWVAAEASRERKRRNKMSPPPRAPKRTKCTTPLGRGRCSGPLAVSAAASSRELVSGLLR